MSSGLVIEVESASLEQVGVEVAVVGFFVDERPLRAGAGVADWRLCGWVSELVLRGEIEGRRDEGALIPTFERLRAPGLLLLGLGARAEFGPEGVRHAAESAVRRLAALRIRSALLDLPRWLDLADREGVVRELMAGLAAPELSEASPLLLRLRAPADQAGGLRTALERAAAALPPGMARVRPPAATPRSRPGRDSAPPPLGRSAGQRPA